MTFKILLCAAEDNEVSKIEHEFLQHCIKNLEELKEYRVNVFCLPFSISTVMTVKSCTSMKEAIEKINDVVLPGSVVEPIGGNFDALLESKKRMGRKER